MKLLHYLLWCSTIIDYYTVPRNVAFRHQIFLHPGKLGLGLLFSFLHVYQEKRPNIDAVKCILSQALSPSTGTRWSGSNLCGILYPRPICPREGTLLCAMETSNVNFWFFFIAVKGSDAKRGLLRHHGDSGKSSEDLRFWKSMNELNIPICADFT